MIIYLIFLLLVLSIEATLGLPIFFIYWSWRLSVRYQKPQQIFALFLISLLIALFYALSWPLLALILLILYFFWQKIPTTYWLTKFILVLLFFFAFFFLAHLHFTYFYLLHFLIFCLYFYRNNFRHYAS